MSMQLTILTPQALIQLIAKNVYVVCLCTVFGRTVCFCFDTSLASSNHLLCIAELNYFFGQTAEPLYYSP